MKNIKSAVLVVGLLAQASQAYAQTSVEPRFTNSQPIVITKEIIVDWTLIPTTGSYRVMKHSNLRSGPGIEHNIIGKLKPNAVIQIIGTVKDKNWYLLRQGSAVEGYIHSSLIEAVSTVEFPGKTITPIGPVSNNTANTEVIEITPKAVLSSNTNKVVVESAAKLNRLDVDVDVDEEYFQEETGLRLGYLTIGMSLDFAIRELKQHFRYVETYDTGVYTIVAGNEACFVAGVQQLSREQFEQTVLDQLIDSRFLRPTGTFGNQVNECIAVEANELQVSGISHFSINTGLTDSTVSSTLLNKFGPPDFQQSSLNANERYMGWFNRNSEYLQEFLSASILFADNSVSGVLSDNFVLTRLVLQTR